MSKTRSRVEISRGCQQTCNMLENEATVPRKGSCTCMHDAERVVSRTESRTIDLSGVSGNTMLPSHSRNATIPAFFETLRFKSYPDTCRFFRALKNCLCQDKVNQPRNRSNSGCIIGNRFSYGCILCPFYGRACRWATSSYDIWYAGRIKTSRTF